MRFLPTLLAQGKRALSQSNVGVHLTESCVKRLHQLQNERSKEVYLRVAVDGGGCSGFQYSFALEESACDDDRVYEVDGAKVLVDDVSFEFLQGATVDYAHELIRSSFTVADNPNTEAHCGCGSSFMAK